jgi:hypothetical protein
MLDRLYAVFAALLQRVDPARCAAVFAHLQGVNAAALVKTSSFTSTVREVSSASPPAGPGAHETPQVRHWALELLKIVARGVGCEQISEVSSEALGDMLGAM